MNTKGTAVRAIKEYVVREFGTRGYEQWLLRIPDPSKAIFKGAVLASGWYPARDGVIEPLRAMCELFYRGDADGARQQGRFSADQDLRGVYKAFVKVASPQFLMRNVAAIWGSYYTDTKATATKLAEKTVRLEINNIDPDNPYNQHAIIGWAERALEICGCREITITADNKPAGGRANYRFEISWK
jgi:hypothetical protein